MQIPQPRRHLSRRHFLRRGATVGLIGMSWSGIHRESLAEDGRAGQQNAFAYDVSRLAKTDPRLLQYQETARFPAPREGARRIAVTGDGRIYLVAGAYVVALDAAGTTVSEIALSGPARCLGLAASGDLFVGLRDHVEVFDAKGQRRAAWNSLEKRAWLTGIALSNQGVFLADAGNRVVLRCDPASGKIIHKIGERNKERNIPGFIVPSPFFDLEMHADGLLRITNPGRHRVEAYTVNGEFEFAWGKPSTAIEGFCGCCNPIAIALLPGGEIVTAEKGLPRVKVYSPDGLFQSVVAGPELFPQNAQAGAGDSASDGVRAGLDVAVDAKGRVYVLDQVAGNVHVLQRRT